MGDNKNPQFSELEILEFILAELKHENSSMSQTEWVDMRNEAIGYIDNMIFSKTL